jgi:hypothetical protein
MLEEGGVGIGVASTLCKIQRVRGMAVDVSYEEGMVSIEMVVRAEVRSPVGGRLEREGTFDEDAVDVVPHTRVRMGGGGGGRRGGEFPLRGLDVLAGVREAVAEGVNKAF